MLKKRGKKEWKEEAEAIYEDKWKLGQKTDITDHKVVCWTRRM